MLIDIRVDSAVVYGGNRAENNHTEPVNIL